MELCCLVLRSFWYFDILCFTIAIDLNGAWGRRQYNIRCSVEFKFFVKDIERYVIHIRILQFYAIGLPTLAIGVLSTSTLEWISSVPDFLCLVNTPLPCRFIVRLSQPPHFSL